MTRQYFFLPVAERLQVNDRVEQIEDVTLPCQVMKVVSVVEGPSQMSVTLEGVSVDGSPLTVEVQVPRDRQVTLQPPF